MFNVFKSAIAYDTSIKTLPNIAKDGGEEQMVEYEFEPDTKEEVMQVRHEWHHIIYKNWLEAASPGENVLHACGVPASTALALVLRVGAVRPVLA